MKHSKLPEDELNQSESDRILKQIKKFIKEGRDYTFVKENIASDIWDSEKIENFVNSNFHQEIEKHWDRSIYPSTVSGCIHGFIIGSFIGSIVWASVEFYFEDLHLWILVINYYITYLFTMLFTGQNKENFLVYFTSILATMASFFGGYYVLELLGHGL